MVNRFRCVLRRSVQASAALLLLGVALAASGGSSAPALAGQAPAADSGAAVNLGHVQIVADPSLASRLNPCSVGGSPVAGSALAPSFTLAPSLLSLDQAQQSVDFTILQPSWLPSDMEQLQWAEVSPGDRVDLSYRDTAASPKSAGLTGFALAEQPWSDVGGQFFVPAAPTAGTVAGQPAAFWTSTPISCQGAPSNLPTFQLAAWEDGGLLIELSGMGLSMDDIQQIGASLAGNP